MRNLKRVLSLALASIMVVSMMVIGAGAANFDDFSDKDEIVNKEAVSVLVELGVLAGKDDGSYDPTGIITRGEMAKIICVVLNKGQDPNLGSVTSNTYTDTVGHWAAAYIEYCTTLGIVAGKGDGTFAPNDTVTAANWAVATNVLANKNGLYDGLTLDVSAGLTRDNAAQMMYNALDAKVVAYDYSVIPSGDSVSAIATAEETGKTLLEDKFGAVKVTGVVVRNEYGSVTGATPLDEGETYLVVTNYGTNEEQQALDTGKYNFTTDLDLLGKSVSVYVKPGNSKVTTAATVLGSAIEGSNTVVTLTSGHSSKSITERLKSEDMKIDVAADEDDTTHTTFVINYTNAYGTIDALTGHKNNVNGVEIVAIDNDDDGVADYVLQNFEVFGKVTSYNTKEDGTITISASNVADKYGFWDSDAETYTKKSVKMDDAADVVGFDDVEKDDYVFAQEIGGKLYVRVAEAVELEPSSTQGDNFKADGTTYKKAGTVDAVNEADKKTLAEAVEIGEAANVYMDAYGYVVYITDVDTTLEYLYLTAATYDAVDGARAKVVFADGTTDTITINKVDDNDVEAKPGENQIYSYTVSGSKYALTSVSEKDVTTVKEGNATLGTGVYADSKTVFVVKAGSSWEVYTGIANVPNLTAPKDGTFEAVAACDKNGTADVVFVTVSDRSGTENLANSIYVLNEKPTVSKNADGGKVYTYTVIYKGEKVEMKADGEFKTIQTGLYLSSSVTANGVLTALGDYTAPAEATKASNGIVATADKAYTVTDDTVFIAVDDEDIAEVDLGYITTKTDDSKGDLINVIPDKDNNNLAAYVFILE